MSNIIYSSLSTFPWRVLLWLSYVQSGPKSLVTSAYIKKNFPKSWKGTHYASNQLHDGFIKPYCRTFWRSHSHSGWVMTVLARMTYHQGKQRKIIVSNLKVNIWEPVSPYFSSYYNIQKTKKKIARKSLGRCINFLRVIRCACFVMRTFPSRSLVRNIFLRHQNVFNILLPCVAAGLVTRDPKRELDLYQVYKTLCDTGYCSYSHAGAPRFSYFLSGLFSQGSGNPL